MVFARPPTDSAPAAFPFPAAIIISPKSVLAPGAALAFWSADAADDAGVRRRVDAAYRCSCSGIAATGATRRADNDSKTILVENALDVAVVIDVDGNDKGSTGCSSAGRT